MGLASSDFSKFIKRSVFAALTLGAVAFMAKSADAVTITIGGTATITCTDSADPACLGFVGVGTLDNTAPFTAALFDLANNNPVTEASFLNSLAGTSFTTGTQTDFGGVSTASFITNAAYFMIKLGAGEAFFQNFGLGPITVQYAANGLQGGGLSHITEFGVIPLPAALPLLLTALGGLFFVGRRRREA